MKHFIFVLLLVFLLLSLTACESRVSQPASPQGGAEAVSPSPYAEAPRTEGQALPDAVTPPPAPADGREAIADAARISQARVIVFELLQRAAVADEIYRATLLRDEYFDPVIMGEYEYFPVIDERFFTVQDIQIFLDSTFTRGGEATRRFEELQNNAVYISINGELFVNTAPRPRPFTTGDWQLDTMELLLIDDHQLEVRMETTLLGIPNGPKTLRIIRDGENWLLGDSFFFD